MRSSTSAIVEVHGGATDEVVGLCYKIQSTLLRRFEVANIVFKRIDTVLSIIQARWLWPGVLSPSIGAFHKHFSATLVRLQPHAW